MGLWVKGLVKSRNDERKEIHMMMITELMRRIRPTLLSLLLCYSQGSRAGVTVNEVLDLALWRHIIIQICV